MLLLITSSTDDEDDTAVTFVGAAAADVVVAVVGDVAFVLFFAALLLFFFLFLPMTYVVCGWCLPYFVLFDKDANVWCCVVDNNFVCLPHSLMMMMVAVAVC
jgi:hypothetical protein